MTSTADYATILAEHEVRRILPARFREGFDALESFTPEHAALIDAAQVWADAWAPGAPGLILAGVVGCGKSHLACAIAKRLIERGVRVARYNTADLLVDIKAAWDRRDDTEADLIDELLAHQVILLDDLGVEAPRPWITERLYAIVNRCGEAERTLIVTTNETAESLTRRYGEGSMGLRILSRVKALCTTLGPWPRIDLRQQLRPTLQTSAPDATPDRAAGADAAPAATREPAGAAHDIPQQEAAS